MLIMIYKICTEFGLNFSLNKFVPSFYIAKCHCGSLIFAAVVRAIKWVPHTYLISYWWYFRLLIEESFCHTNLILSTLSPSISIISLKCRSQTLWLYLNYTKWSDHFWHLRPHPCSLCNPLWSLSFSSTDPNRMLWKRKITQSSKLTSLEAKNCLGTATERRKNPLPSSSSSVK